MNPFLKNFDEVILFRQTLTDETDRGVALVCAAYLEEELKRLLQKAFVDVPAVVDQLFKGTGPLATFSSRIDLAFTVGLISRESHRALHLIRKTRNDFAHGHKERSFRDADISARCGELIPLNPYLDEKNPRKLYIRAVLTIVAVVHAKMELAEHSEVPPWKSLDVARDSFTAVQKNIDALFANLTEEQMSRLLNPDSTVAERKRLIFEAVARAGATETEPNSVPHGKGNKRTKRYSRRGASQTPDSGKSR
jgi:DNA-binding MltR family transcriptional regulator